MDIHDISPATGLDPKVKFFAEVDDNCLNVDAVIFLMKEVDTPKAKRLYRAFRRRHAEARLNPADRSPQKMREDALFQALADCGHRVSFTPVSGSMDGGC